MSHPSDAKPVRHVLCDGQVGWTIAEDGDRAKSEEFWFMDDTQPEPADFIKIPCECGCVIISFLQVYIDHDWQADN